MSKSSMSKNKLFALLALFFASLAALPAQSRAAGFEGYWEGAFIWEKAEREGDFVVDFIRNPDGRMVGLIGLPLQGLEDQPLHNVKDTGRQISFEYRDETSTSYLEGTLSADGRRIEGTMREKDKAYPFYLERKEKPVPPAPQALKTLSPDFHELRDAFNRDAGHVRALVVLSPKCITCLASARAVQRYVLDEVANDQLRFYVVWAPMMEEDDRESAQRALVHMADPRVTQFWINDKSVATAIAKRFDLPEQKGWDLFFFYSPQAVWKSGIPAPDDYMHSLHKTLGEDRHFNAIRMEKRVREMLSATGAAR